jgi:hypothetical protein
MIFDVITAVKMSMVALWFLVSCGLVGGYQRLGGSYRLHLLRNNGTSLHHIEDLDRFLVLYRCVCAP